MSTDQLIPWISSSTVMLKVLLTFAAIREQFGHPPAMPRSLSVTAAATPETAVPCPALSRAEPDSSGPAKLLCATTFAPRSGCPPSMPVSTTAILALFLPRVVFQAVGALILSRPPAQPKGSLRTRDCAPAICQNVEPRSCVR